MIEAVLLFFLGFLSAAFLAFLVAPSIQRRVVAFTENRLKATLPISQQELKAQKDMVRAQYAAENAKLSQAVIRERERSVEARRQVEGMAAASQALAAEKADLEALRDEMENEIRELRSALRSDDAERLGLRAELAAAKFTANEDAAKIRDIGDRLAHLSEMFDSAKIELAARDTELEGTHASFNAFKAERDKAREKEREADERALAAETRLSREVNKVLRLQDRLDRELAENVRRETAMSRRSAEVARLKERLKTANAQARKALRALKDAGIDLQIDVQDEPSVEADDIDQGIAEAERLMESDMAEMQVAETPLDPEVLTAQLHADEGAVSETLLQEPGPEDDEHMREEIASIAARMVALTAAREGENSPLKPVLSGERDKGKSGRVSLGKRAFRLLQGDAQ